VVAGIHVAARSPAGRQAISYSGRPWTPNAILGNEARNRKAAAAESERRVIGSDSEQLYS
jgi:hypothetical protein